ncbi:MAG TPA: putative manganese-dependent inorganic diphosphatase [Candidatus Scybalocola faecipullorum]|nr:putative manganese-dependent inorganic diphosphatase [Candidatus Scybalocola faecipullorum]
MSKRNEVYVFGHKNPDTDSICAAIACAYLKNKISETSDKIQMANWGSVEENSIYIPKRAGVISPETDYVLKRFHVPAPGYTADVRRQVRDINIRKIAGISSGVSLKRAWTQMRSVNTATMPVLDEEGHLEGLITIGDIARAYMAVFDNRILGESKTPYENVLNALDGTMLIGDPAGVITDGKVVIATTNVEVMKSHIAEHDIIILGNRYETQLCAIENKASCIIVCEGEPVSRTIRKLAENAGCTVISSPHDTYTVARLINQSVPVSYFMTRDHLVTFRKKEFIEDIKGTMTKLRHRDFPIVTKDNKFVGMISRRSLINMPSKKIVLVDHNEPDQAVDGLFEAEVVEIIDHHKLSTVETNRPVAVRNQPVGCTSTIIYQMFIENDIDIPADIAGLLCSAIISDTLLFRSPTCTPDDEAAARALADIAGADPETLASEMFGAGTNAGSRTDEEIFYQDFKRFTAANVHFGVGQTMVMSRDAQYQLKERLLAYMKTQHSEADMLFFMITNVLDESTLLLFAGTRAREVISESFDGDMGDGAIYLPGVVSRKKQMVPQIMAALQQ